MNNKKQTARILAVDDHPGLYLMILWVVLLGLVVVCSKLGL
jgi:hypothetical protein